MSLGASTVIKKYIMGLSGLVWAGFVFVHMAGNMLILVDKDAFNSYGHSIVSNKPLLYGTEVALVLALIAHVFCAISLTIQNKKARPTGYQKHSSGGKGASFGSSWMIIQGSVVLAFIILHLATFKYGPYYETTVHGVVMRDLYRLVTEVFRNPSYVAWYVVSLLLLGIHLTHGIRSIFQSFGLLHPAYQNGIRFAGALYGVVVACGFLCQPIFVYFLV